MGNMLYATEPPPRIVGVQLDGDQLSVSWTAVPGFTYDVQFVTALGQEWTPVPGRVTAAGNVASQSLSVAGMQAAFVRVVRVP